MGPIGRVRGRAVARRRRHGDSVMLDSQNSVYALFSWITMRLDVWSVVCAVLARAMVLRNPGSREIALFARGHEFSSFQISAARNSKVRQQEQIEHHILLPCDIPAVSVFLSLSPAPYSQECSPTLSVCPSQTCPRTCAQSRDSMAANSMSRVVTA